MILCIIIVQLQLEHYRLGKGHEGVWAGRQGLHSARQHLQAVWVNEKKNARQHRHALWVKERKEDGLGDKAKAALGSIAKLFG